MELLPLSLLSHPQTLTPHSHPYLDHYPNHYHCIKLIETLGQVLLHGFEKATSGQQKHENFGDF